MSRLRIPVLGSSMRRAFNGLPLSRRQHRPTSKVVEGLHEYWQKGYHIRSLTSSTALRLRTEKILRRRTEAPSPILDTCDLVNMPKRSLNPVTFGVEAEFIVPANGGPYGNLTEIPRDKVTGCNAEPDVEGVYTVNEPERHLAIYLRRNGFKAMTALEKLTLAYKPELLEKFPTDYGRDQPRTAYTDYFLVKSDASIQVDRYSEYRDKDFAIELSTPALPFTPNSVATVAKVLSMVFTSFNAKVNKTCGLHVHVGADDMGFDMEWLRSIASVAWSSSSLMDLLHPARRGPAFEYAYGLHHFSNLANSDEILRYKGPNAPVACSHSRQVNLVNPQKSMFQGGLIETWVRDPWLVWCGLQHLAQANNYKDVVEMMLHASPSGISDKRMAYNFMNLRYQDDDKRTAPRTIEFRQHEGTVDVEAISMWVNVVCGLVDIARSNPAQAELVSLKAANAAMGLGSYNAIDIIRDIGCKEQAEYYQGKLRKEAWEDVKIDRSAQVPARRKLGAKVKNAILLAVRQLAEYLFR